MIATQRRPVSVDLFAGGGGASEGIRCALGRDPVLAVDHCEHAIQMHARNHPRTVHLCESVFDVEPSVAAGGRDIDLLWASPDCTHFSRAKGGKPVKKEIRGLAWVVVRWAKQVRPSIICVENVPEFQGWGPLDEHNRPIQARKGEIFREWVSQLEGEGYHVEWRVLAACDYGTPTTRKRLFVAARRDGLPIVWPEPTHGPGWDHPYRTAAECIDWSISCPSIFARKRPLAVNTQRRIAEGLRRYVLESASPFIAQGTHHGLVTPYVYSLDHQSSSPSSATGAVSDPVSTITSKARHCIVAPVLIQSGYGERKDHHSLCTAALGQVGERARQVAAFLVAYYGSEEAGQTLDEPLRTIVEKARFGLVTITIEGTEYAIVDIGMRMLQPRELARAQGFPDDYVLPGTKTQQIARIGNSVCPPVAEALVRAQFEDVVLPPVQASLWGAL